MLAEFFILFVFLTVVLLAYLMITWKPEGFSGGRAKSAMKKSKNKSQSVTTYADFLDMQAKAHGNAI